MISIQKEIREGVGLQHLLELVRHCYQGVVEDAKVFAVDFGELTPPYQANLAAILTAMATQEWDETSLNEFRAALRTSFRSFKDKAEQKLYRLKNDLNQTATSLTAVLKSLEYDEPALTLRTQVKQLSDLQKIDEIEQLKNVLKTALVQLEKGLDETEKRNRMVISDLQTEVSMLHNRVAVLAEQKVGERSLRLVLDERLLGEAVVLLVVRLAGLGRLKTQHGDAGVEVVLKAAQKRLREAMEPVLAIGLWDEQTVGMLTNPTGASAASLTKKATMALSGRYELMGEAVSLQASAGVLEWRPPDDGAQFMRRLQDLLHVLRG